MLRKLFQTQNPASQGIVVSGSGTLGWDMVASSLLQRGDDALLLNIGYFGDMLSDCLETYGANVTQLKAPIGTQPSLQDIENTLKERYFKAVTITHVDTSTGVLSDLKNIAALVRRVSPETLIIVDGVCSVSCEEIAFDEWDIDVVLTASQKAIGCPPGLSILMVSGRALKTLEERTTPPSSYYASLAKWLPVMRNYENMQPSYFATPPTQLVHALHTALSQAIVDLPARFARHNAVSDKIKNAVRELGLSQLASKPEDQAHSMTTIVLPEGTKGSDILPVLSKKNLVFAGGIIKECASSYIRFGHMGVSVMDPERRDVDRAIQGLQESFGGQKTA